MLKFELKFNRQTLYNNIASLEKSPIFTAYKSFNNLLYLIK